MVSKCVQQTLSSFKLATVTKQFLIEYMYYCFILSQNELKFKLQLHDNKQFNIFRFFF
jgi:hypothetical protein